MNSKLASLTLIALMVLGTVAVFAPKANAAGTTMNVISTGGSAPGTSNAFYGPQPVGTNVVFNITVTGVTNLANWQFQIGWNASMFSFVSLTLPADQVFAASGAAMITPPPVVNPGDVTWGCTFIQPSPPFGFTGDGILAQLTLKTLVAADPLHMVESSNVGILNIGSNTFMLDMDGHDISFTNVDALYVQTYTPPSTIPVITLVPSVEKPAKIGDTFGLDVMVSNIDAGWMIIGFQFSVQWNTTLMTPAATPFTNGTLMEGYEYAPGGVLYAADVNEHFRPLPLHGLTNADYNFSTFAAILSPDSAPNPPYHGPFVSGSGKLMTIYFTATYDTISPIEYWSSIDFIHFAPTEDTYALDQYLHVVNVDSSTGAQYRAPQKVLGLSIDLYTQYPFPYGGQGGNQTSDSFGPQAQVDLFALVTYNEYGVQQKLVGYQIFHQGLTQIYNIYREGTTDANGIAHVAFRLPWPCADPVHEIFGWWYVNATVEVAQETVVDNLKFWVWWPVEVVSIEPKSTGVTQTKQGCSLDFEMIYRRYDAQTIPVTLTATAYDELGFFIGSAFLQTTVSNDPVPYDALGNPIPKDFVWDFTIVFPSNAVVGKGIIYGNAFTDFPWNGGTPYCPEVTNTIDFYINKP